MRFVILIVHEPSKNGAMEPKRLLESPYTDHAHTGPRIVLPNADMEVIVDAMSHFKRTVVAEEVA